MGRQRWGNTNITIKILFSLEKKFYVFIYYLKLNSYTGRNLIRLCASGVGAAWLESGLTWAEFLPGSTGVAVQQFVADDKLEWTAAAAQAKVVPQFSVGEEYAIFNRPGVAGAVL